MAPPGQVERHPQASARTLIEGDGIYGPHGIQNLAPNSPVRQLNIAEQMYAGTPINCLRTTTKNLDAWMEANSPCPRLVRAVSVICKGWTNESLQDWEKSNEIIG